MLVLSNAGREVVHQSEISSRDLYARRTSSQSLYPLWTKDEWPVSYPFYGRPLYTNKELVIFRHHQLPPCPWVISRIILSYFHNVHLTLATGRAMCHNFIDKLTRLVIFSRSMPRVVFWLVALFHIPKLTAYKQQNSFSTLHISEISFLEHPRLSASSRSILSSLVSSSRFRYFFNSRPQILSFLKNF